MAVWMRRVLPVLCVLALVGAACGEPQRVGSERLLEGVEDEENGGPRLGERAEEEEEEAEGEEGGRVAVEDEPDPTPEPTPQPTPEEVFFDVALVPHSPYYEPGNRIIISAGMTLRVTNADDSSERPERSFTARDGSFDSGMLAHGETWTRTFDAPGTYEVADNGVPFATAVLEVR